LQEMPRSSHSPLFFSNFLLLRGCLGAARPRSIAPRTPPPASSGHLPGHMYYKFFFHSQLQGANHGPPSSPLRSPACRCN
jgi:hypothetical protein